MTGTTRRMQNILFCTCSMVHMFVCEFVDRGEVLRPHHGVSRLSHKGSQALGPWVVIAKAPALMFVSS